MLCLNEVSASEIRPKHHAFTAELTDNAANQRHIIPRIDAFHLLDLDRFENHILERTGMLYASTSLHSIQSTVERHRVWLAMLSVKLARSGRLQSCEPAPEVEPTNSRPMILSGLRITPHRRADGDKLHVFNVSAIDPSDPTVTKTFTVTASQLREYRRFQQSALAATGQLYYDEPIERMKYVDLKREWSALVDLHLKVSARSMIPAAA